MVGQRTEVRETNACTLSVNNKAEISSAWGANNLHST
jgi:hypothetical protein